MGGLRLLLADDSEAFRDGLRAMLAAVDDVTVVAEATDGEAAVRLALELQPDVVLMDLSMPGVDGVEATRALTGAAPHIGVVALTLRADDDAVLAALTAGARGYVVKGAQKAEVLWAVRAVAAGEAVFGPAVAARIAHLVSRARPAGGAAEFPELTQREREVLALLAAHHTNPEIARRLGISLKTVRNHVSNVLTKLQVVDRASAIVKARESGWSAG